MNPDAFEEGYDSEGELPIIPECDSNSDDDGYEFPDLPDLDSVQEGGEGEDDEKGEEPVH